MILFLTDSNVSLLLHFVANTENLLPYTKERN